MENSLGDYEGDNIEALIAIIKHHNHHSTPPSNSFTTSTPTPTPKQSSTNIINTSIQAQRCLQFKPWSGLPQGDITLGEGMDEIREEVGEENEGNQEEGWKIERQVRLTTNQVEDDAYYYKFQTGGVKLIKELLEENGFKNNPQGYEDWTLYWSSGSVKLDVYPLLNPYQKVNHFPNSIQLTRKDLMNKNISKMQIKFGISHFNFLPKTFILPAQTSQFEAQYRRNKKIYIVKPHNRSQGKGIIVTNQIETIYSRLQKYSSLVVSEYIDNPLLINGFKFDLRIYVGLTSVYPLKIYVHEEGLARFATERYNNEMETEKKNFRHLTNYSVNKKNENFVGSSAPDDDYFGSKWSLTSLKDFLEFNVGKVETVELFERINDLVVKTLLSVENLLYTSVRQSVPYINNCFEILGFDVLIDSALKPWLVEVNLSPSMNTDSPLDLKIKGSVVSDMFTMLGIIPHSSRYTSNFHLKNLTSKYMNAKGNNIQMSSFDEHVVREAESQVVRSGGWNRVFPSGGSSKYRNFFDSARYLNTLFKDIPKDIPVPFYLPLRPKMEISQPRSYVEPKRSQSKDKGFFHRRPSLKFRIH